MATPCRFHGVIAETLPGKQKSLYTPLAWQAKRKGREVMARSRGLVQNRVTVLDKTAFSLAVYRQMKINQPFPFFHRDL
jgi:hypothetical protein